MKFFFIFLLVALYFPFQAQAQQEIRSLPIQFNQYMRSYPIINPASSGASSDIEINTGNQRHGQSWSNISTFYINANFRIYKGMKIKKETDEYMDESEEYETQSVDSEQPAPTRFHVAGLNIIGDKEGSFLRRTGVYGIYAWHIQLSQNMFVAGGAAIGIKNYSIGENYVNGGGSSFAPDGNVGIWIYDRRYHIGFSVNQVFNGKLKPLYETTRLIPHFNLTTGRSFSINPYLDLKPSFLIRIAADQQPDIDISIGSMWQNLISATVNYRHQKGVATMLGIEKISLGNNSFKAMFSYYIPFIKTNQINNYTYEITLNYFLNARNKEHSVFL